MNNNKIKFDVNWQVWAEDTKGNKHCLLAFEHKHHAENFWKCQSPHNKAIRNEIFNSLYEDGILIKRVFVKEDFHY